MSFKNWKPRVWNAAIQTELVQESVFLKHCYREHEGDVKGLGDSVKILGVGKPTITTQVGGNVTLQEPEVIEDTSSLLLIDHVSYYNFMVDDIDKSQAAGNVMSIVRGEASEGLASEVDKCIAALAYDKLAPKLQSSAITLTKDTVFGVLDKAIQRLLEENVSRNTKLYATIPPWMWVMLFGRLAEFDTDNSQRIRTLNIGNYGNLYFECSNNVYRNNNVDYVSINTERAISAVVAKTHSEAYRPEKSFADAVKGYTLYGSKIQRPKEMIVVPCKAGA